MPKSPFCRAAVRTGCLTWALGGAGQRCFSMTCHLKQKLPSGVMATQSVVLEEGIDEDYEPSSEGTPSVM